MPWSPESQYAFHKRLQEKLHESRKSPQGLSTGHISSSLSLEVASGGSLVKLTGIRRTLDDKPENENTKRGVITVFTRKARQRLLRVIASIDVKRAGLPTFLTLTYPGEYSLDWRVWKRDLDRMATKIRRRWSGSWGLWRLEFQKRGAPHFHFLLWDGPVVEDVMKVWSNKKRPRPGWVFIGDRKNKNNQELFKWVSDSWFDVVGSGDERHRKAGSRIEPIQTWNGVVYYVSKYIAKTDENNGPSDAIWRCHGRACKSDLCGGDESKCPYGESTGAAVLEAEKFGRYWGYVKKDSFPIEIIKWDLTDAAFNKIKRVIKRKIEKTLGKSISCVPYEGLTTYMSNDEAQKLLTWASEKRNNPPKWAPF